MTVAGANFYDTSKSPLTVTAHPVAPTGLQDQTPKPASVTLTQIQFDAKTFPSGCYQVEVKVGTQQAPKSNAAPPKDEFVWFLNPKIDSATLSDLMLKVALDQLPTLPDCRAALTFRATSDAPGDTPHVIANPQFSADNKTATLTLPTLPTGAMNWKTVEALVGGSPMQPAVTAAITK